MAKIVPYEADTKQAVLQEYDILKSLHHDRIMALHEAYVTPRYLVLISEYCSGRELLYSLIERSRTESGSSLTFPTTQGSNSRPTGRIQPVTTIYGALETLEEGVETFYHVGHKKCKN